MTRLLDRAVAAAAIAGGTLLALIALFMTADVVLRYAFNRPIFGAQDALELLSVAVVFGGVAYCGRTDGHVAVDLFFTRLSARARRRSDIAVKSVALAIVALLAWQSGARLFAFDGADATNLLGIPRWPFYGIVCLGAGLYAAVLAVELAALIRPKAGHP